MHEALGLLGLCLRAGKLIAGEEAVSDCVREGKARLLLLAQDAGATTAKRARRAGQERNVPLVRLAVTTQELGAALGRTSCAVCCITDAGFAAAAAKKAAADFPENEQAVSQTEQKNIRIQSRRGTKKHRKAPGGSAYTHKKSGGERA